MEPADDHVRLRTVFLFKRIQDTEDTVMRTARYQDLLIPFTDHKILFMYKIVSSQLSVFFYQESFIGERQIV